MKTNFFSIDDLAEETGIPVRTIRYYISEGLLPSPQVRGRNTYYTRETLNRLALIQRLKDAHLPLREIRDQMAVLTDAQVQALLDQQGEANQVQAAMPAPQIAPLKMPPDTDITPAADYVSRLLEARSTYAQGDRVSANRPLRKMPAAQEPHNQSWRRIPIDAGLELHVLEPLDAARESKVRQIVEMIQIILR